MVYVIIPKPIFSGREIYNILCRRFDLLSTFSPFWLNLTPLYRIKSNQTNVHVYQKAVSGEPTCRAPNGNFLGNRPVGPPDTAYQKQHPIAYCILYVTQTLGGGVRVTR